MFTKQILFDIILVEKFFYKFHFKEENKNEIKKPKNIKKGATNNVSLAKSKKEAMND